MTYFASNAAFGPIGYVGDAAPRLLSDAACSKYLAANGARCLADLTTGPAANALTALAFEYALLVNPALLVDFTIGPERVPLNKTKACGGPLAFPATLEDVCDLYVPRSWDTFARQVLSIQQLPTFKSLGLDYTSGQLDQQSDTVARAMATAVGRSGRPMPASEQIPSAFDKYNYARSLRDLLHDGPSITKSKPNYPDFGLGQQGASPFSIDWRAVTAGVAAVGAVAATVTTAGAAAPLLGVALSLAENALRNLAVQKLSLGHGFSTIGWSSKLGPLATGILNDATLNVDQTLSDIVATL